MRTTGNSKTMTEEEILMAQGTPQGDLLSMIPPENRGAVRKVLGVYKKGYRTSEGKFHGSFQEELANSWINYLRTFEIAPPKSPGLQCVYLEYISAGLIVKYYKHN